MDNLKLLKKYIDEYQPFTEKGNGEKTEILSENDNYRIEKIISYGAVTCKNFWYDQNEDEFVYILQGKGELEFKNGDKLILNKGEFYNIKKHILHRVSFTSLNPPCVWLCLFAK